LREVYLLAALAKPTGLGLVEYLIEAAIATAQKDAPVVRALDDAYGHIVGGNHKDGLVHQLHFVARTLAEGDAQDNDLDGRGEEQEVLDVLHKNAGLWFDQANANNQVAQSIVVGHVPCLVEGPNVDLRVDGQPGTTNFREQAHGAVAFYVCKGESRD